MRMESRVCVVILMVAGAFCSCRGATERSEAEALKALHDSALFEVSRNLEVPEGFQVELIYAVPLEEQGSWVALTPDAAGRLITSDQFGGLYRVTVGEDASGTTVEKLNVSIGHAQGLLYAYGSLYVTVNLYRTAKEKVAQGSGFYRLLDSDGDDQFDQVKLLKRLETVENENGHGEHGPHAPVLGPDGLIYQVAGNGTSVPQGLEPTSPHRGWADDLLIPSNDAFVPGGWIARTNETGETWELFAGGLRNPYDIAFHPDGELFTFDADSAIDIGMPWYRPTRINHVVSAGEYGWRYDRGPWRPYGKWPEHYPDSVGSVVDIGFGSPTGLVFGTGARFPARYQRALFACDWASGKIYAVHLQPQGASYKATFETFLTGSALPLTDVVIHQDGALYFTVGGREAKSGLFRIRYTGDETTDPVGPIDDPVASRARELRRRLEQFHGRNDPRAVEEAWPHLASHDRALRYAARIAIEHQDPASWRDRALQENNHMASIQAMLGLARVGAPELQGKVLRRLDRLPLEQLPEEQLLEALRAYGLTLLRMGGRGDGVGRRIIKRLEHLFPSSSQALNWELCRLLAYVQDPAVIRKSLKLLRASQEQDQMFYFATLSQLRDGWSLRQLRVFLSSLNLAQEEYLRGEEVVGRSGLNRRFIDMIASFRQNVVESLSDQERAALEEIIEGQQDLQVAGLEPSRPFVQDWQIADFLPLLKRVESGRSYQSGKSAYQAAACAKCHRFGDQGGTTGPDITAVGNRFDAQYLLESLLLPSKVIPDRYLNEVIRMENGLIHTGRVVYEDGKLLRIREDPFTQRLSELAVNKIETRTLLNTSEMPEGLLNVLTEDEILDLIAYLGAGGNANDRVFE